MNILAAQRFDQEIQQKEQEKVRISTFSFVYKVNT